jgi:hypothetical protein
MTSTDQVRLPIYRALSAVQVLVGVPFGVLPLVAPQLAAAIVGYAAVEPFVYRLAGAAAIGYSVSAAFVLMGSAWYEQRIPLVATFVFNAAAVLAAVLTLAEGGSSWIVLFILVAATGFALLSAYWLRRDQGPVPPTSTPIAGTVRTVLALATLSAAVFGLGPLLAAAPFATAFGLAPRELFVYRLAGAATFGYAVAGILEIRDGRWEAIRIQVIAAVVFNALAAGAALAYVAAGGGSLLGPVVVAAATFFAVALTVSLARVPRLG